jgi:hypothetical protein
VSDGAERADIAEQAAREVAGIYQQATLDVLDKVARRLARGVDETGWAEAKAHQLLDLSGGVQQIAGRLNKRLPGQAKQVIDRAYAAGRHHGVQGTSTRAVDQLANDLAGTLTSTTPRILRWSHDVYRSVISEAVGQTAAGAVTTREAAARALDGFAARGVTGFVDKAGGGWNLASYVEMATRTGTMNAHLAGTTDRLTSEGHDLVVVSDAPAECPLCRPWEGKVLSLHGKSPGYPTVHEARDAGLFHPNCRHGITAYMPGLSRDVPGEADPEGAKNRQHQRYLERRIRAAKRRRMAAEPFGGPAYDEAKAAVRREQGRLRSFVREHGLKRLPYREQLRPAKPAPPPAPADVASQAARAARTGDRSVLASADARTVVDAVGRWTENIDGVASLRPGGSHAADGELLQRVLADAPETGHPLYRGMSGFTSEETAKLTSLQPGDVIPVRTASSFSGDRGTAEFYMDEDEDENPVGVLLKLRKSHSIPVGKLNRSGVGDDEYLVGHDLQVVGRTRIGDRAWLLDVKEI